MQLADVKLDDKYTLERGRVYLNGIQALTRLLMMQRVRDAAAGINTAGFVSGFQGSPLNNMDKTLWEAHDLLARHHIHFQPGQNEELAVMGVWGSQQVALDPHARYQGVFGMWYGKWAGLARSGDALLHGNSAGAAKFGGVLLVCGDDHMARSSTIATQSETMLASPLIPVIVPTGVQEYLDLGIHGYAMSRYSGSWIGVKALDDTIECSASVSVDPARIMVRMPEDFTVPPGGLNLRLPDQPLAMERRIHEHRLPAVLAYVRANQLNYVAYDSPRARLGIVAAGKSYLDVRQALEHLGIDGAAAARIGIRVYKLGMTWPLEPQGLHAFALGLEEILVVEEKRPVIEDQIRALLYHWPDTRRPRILGKRDEQGGPNEWLLPPGGELSAEQVALVIAARLARFEHDPRIAERAAWLRAKEVDCSVKSNCVSVTPVETEFGRKRAIDQSSCNKDFSCQNGFCPSFVSVEGGALRRGKATAGADDAFAALPDPALPALARPYSIVVAGVGGTGIITVGALLGMAAHLEGKGVSVLDMTGVAQKGGAVTTFVRIAARPQDLHTIRIAAGEANAIIGSDLLVTAENAILTRMQRGITRAVINTHRMATVAFIKNPDLQTPWVAMEEGLRDAIGAEGTRFLDATRLATGLLGDSLATNIFLLGYAWQMGIVPVSREALFRAIELNGAAVAANQRAFQWGRLACHDPAAVERQAQPSATAVGSDGLLAADLDAAITRRTDELTAYQDARLAQRYQALVARVRDRETQAARGSTRLTDAVVRNYFRLLAIKDEYEVARLYTDGEFERQVAVAFEGDYKLRYHFAPPLWVKADPVTGTPRKRGYGRWMRPLLALLARAKGLRGTWLDPFGHTQERRLERSLVVDYERTVDELVRGLRADNVALACEIAALPASIRGYGHVKRRNLDAAKAREASLLAQFRSPAALRVAIAA